MHFHLTFSGVVCILPLQGRQEHCPFTTRLRVLKLNYRRILWRLNLAIPSAPTYKTCWESSIKSPPHRLSPLWVFSPIRASVSAAKPVKWPASSGTSCRLKTLPGPVQAMIIQGNSAPSPGGTSSLSRRSDNVISPIFHLHRPEQPYPFSIPTAGSCTATYVNTVPMHPARRPAQQGPLFARSLTRCMCSRIFAMAAATASSPVLLV